MPTLHIRNVPDDLYERLQSLAQAKHRSLSAEVIRLLSQALEKEELPLSSVLRRPSFVGTLTSLTR